MSLSLFYSVEDIKGMDFYALLRLENFITLLQVEGVIKEESFKSSAIYSAIHEGKKNALSRLCSVMRSNLIGLKAADDQSVMYLSLTHCLNADVELNL
jgi:hypothetical protein